MNIFYLDEDPVICAQQHCDSHVTKMCVEYAQLLSTAFREHTRKSVSDELGIYKPSFYNHPSCVWVRTYYGGYEYLLKLFEALLKEYTFRYNKVHSAEYLLEPLSNIPEGLHKSIKSTTFHPPICAMDSEYLRDHNNNPVIGYPARTDHSKISSIYSYRHYYREGKKHLLHYSFRKRPEWL